MIKSIKLLRNSTTFKLAVAAGVSFILYELATFLFPILLAIGLAFACTRCRICFPRSPWDRGLSICRVWWRSSWPLWLLACLCFLPLLFILLPLFGQINDLVAKLPDYTTKVESTNMDWLLKDPSQYPRLPYNFETLIDDAMTWVMGLWEVFSGICLNRRWTLLPIWLV